MVISLTTYEECREAFRHRALRQALYDEAAPLMHGVIVNLHGDEHRVRRRYENRLFRPDTFAWYETSVIPAIIDEVLGEARQQGRAELLSVARHTMMTLATRIAGVDVSAEAFDRFARLMERLAKGSTVTHATGDHDALLADGVGALAEVTRDFLEPSIARRRTMVEAVQAGRGDVGELPRDVVTTLLAAAQEMNLPHDVFRREIAYFPWVGSHSTSNQLVHAMHHLFGWLAEHPHDREALTSDHVLRQRFVHESLRLHPASPVALRHATDTITLRSGVTIDAGTVVSLHLVSANRDEAVFGADAQQFNPYRPLADDVAPWGLSFGHGIHACLGQELAAGVPAHQLGGLEHHLLGAVVVMSGVLLADGARPDPRNPAVIDTSTTRTVFSRYPVLLGSLGTADQGA